MEIKRGSTVLYTSGEWDHSSPYALHFGLPLVTRPEMITWLTDQLAARGQAEAPPVYVEGDGWNCWGEAIGTDINDDFTYHVVIPVKSPREGQRLMADLLDFNFGWRNFIPIGLTVDDEVPVIAAITNGAQWSEDSHHLSWEHGTEGSTTPTGVYFSMWPKGRKAYVIEISQEDGAELENWLFSRTAEIVDVVDVESGTPARRS